MDFLTVSILLLLLLALCVIVHFVSKKIPILKVLRVYTIKVNTGRPGLNHGGSLVAKVLKEHHIEHVYTLCGGHISPILVACEEEAIRVIDTRNEASCVFAADAEARITGNVGVAIVTAGPGATNTITAVKNAQMAQTPLLVLSGAAALLFEGRGSLQDIDQMSLFKPLCKYTARIPRVNEIVPILRKAIQQAMSDTPGPVFVEFPIDTIYPYELLLEETLPKQPARNTKEKLIEFIIKVNIGDIFTGAFTEQEYGPLPISFPRHTRAQCDTSIKLFQNSKKPIIVISSQAMLHSVKPINLCSALELMGVPCYLSGMTRGLLGEDNDILLRHKRREALKEADLIVLVGAVCDFRLEYGKALSGKSKKIIVNRNREDLQRNTDVMWNPDLSILGDPALFIESLSQELHRIGYKVSKDWLMHLKERDDLRETENINKSRDPVNKYINPMSLLFQVRETMDKNSIIVVDGGDFVGTASYILKPNGPSTWLDPGPFGTLGVGGGFGLGAKLCKPDSEVWIIYGDGSLGYSIAEFDTFMRHKTPVIAVVGNDACWSQIQRAQVKIFKSEVACNLSFSSYELVAEGYGGVGFQMQNNDPAEIRMLLLKAKEIAKTGKPVLLNFLIGKSNFREGSLSV
ncbi:hypothetical protein LOD99_6722 [Oopsacas minuta]|uniref:2-hydroxyacyl-CoA lyase 2 n=1 Tax=Oopsacas minuta TaxID=111878 RepID=A0AAV7JM89_9METZ|nr:hypothetical protein LOD99_6722 [Oopsacas minuta]